LLGFDASSKNTSPEVSPNIAECMHAEKKGLPTIEEEEAEPGFFRI